MFEDGLSYPARGDWLGRTVIGGLLVAFSFLIFPAILVTGYLIDALERTVAGDEEPPAFDDWGTLFIRGLVGTVITIVYSVVPLVVFGGLAFVLIAVVGIAGGAGDAGGIVAGLGVAALLLLGLLLLPVVFLIYYLVPAALTNYAIEDELGAAFDFGTIKPILLSSEYLIAVLLPLVVAVLLWIATSILGLTGIGLLLVPFLQFYGQLAVFRMFGSAFKSVSGRSAARAGGITAD
ncbi:DUF4013 domain-containing protein [Halohasta salina]|uniref:DUF4013 domain-containing protein n=1 Tax=Halohasta salina TaxID=2961621 RepID=UPI0020A5584E|nr:DUF4013 domain-containing protein [Halohasta salina]